MERSYRRGYTRRTAAGQSGGDETKARRGAIKLTVCAGLFVIAALIKLIFPSFYEQVGAKITTAVDYKTALTVLGEGLSGERKFTTAVGEAFTYAFRGTQEIEPEDSVTETADGIAEGEAVETFGDVTIDESKDAETGLDEESFGETGTGEDEIANAIISAFMQTQEGYSDYSVPAGATYDMPSIGISYAAPISGAITSGYGYREHPADGTVKFHYGVDISAEEGGEITSFADGEVIAVGESTTLGKYILLRHDGAETKYAHCSEILVSEGQAVKKGEQIALAGMTGNATSPCLHFELLIGGLWVNPEYYLLQA